MAVEAAGIYHRTYRSELRLRSARIEYVRLGILLIAVAIAPFIATPFWLTVLNQIGIAVIGALGLNILTGYAGQISLGTGGFLAVGAYTSGLLVARAGLPTIAAIILAVFASAIVGAFFGLPALRLKGLYLAIATLASQFIILYLVRNWDLVTGGVDSLVVPQPELFGFVFRTDFTWYWVIAICALVATVAATNIFRTAVGRAFIAIRDHDIAASVIGVNVGLYKVLAFAVSSGFIGLAGAMTAHYRTIVTWERFTLDVSVLYLAMIIIGGLGSVSGAIFGATFMIILPAYIQQLGFSLRGRLDIIANQIPAVQLMVFGLVIILFLIFEPRGLARLWRRSKDYFRLWPFRY